jgi:Bacterial protein of unknown function (DUF922)
MPSVLFGVYRKLRWTDFQPVATAPPGKPAAAAAETILGHTLSGGVPHNISPPGATPIFQVPDTLSVNVFPSAACWRLASVSAWPGPQQVWLIKHEQGHYDIHALMWRDFFYRIQGMVGQSFPTLATVNAEITAHGAATIGRIAKLQSDYDADTANSQNGGEQWNWWSAIERASQLHRTPLVAGPDGRYLRIELADALHKADLA